MQLRVFYEYQQFAGTTNVHTDGTKSCNLGT